MKRSEIVGPIAQIQNVHYEQGNPHNKEEVWKLLRSLNGATLPPLIPEGILQSSFAKWWSDLKSVLDDLADEAPALLRSQEQPKSAPVDVMLEELLQIARDQQRVLARLSPEKVLFTYPDPETKLRMLLGVLTEAQKKVLKLRYGWETGRTRSTKETAKEFGISPSRVRTIEMTALQKMRAIDPTFDPTDYSPSGQSLEAIMAEMDEMDDADSEQDNSG